MKKTKTTVNPHTGELQIIVNYEALAEINHVHNISEIQGLEVILNYLTNGTPVVLGGGYWAQ